MIYFFVLNILLIAIVAVLVFTWQRSEVISRREAREWMREVLDSALTAQHSRSALDFVEAKKVLHEELPETKREPEKARGAFAQQIEIDGEPVTILSTFDDPTLFDGADDGTDGQERSA